MGLWNRHRQRQAGKYAKKSYYSQATPIRRKSVKTYGSPRDLPGVKQALRAIKDRNTPERPNLEAPTRPDLQP
jgi:hypothetical protein